MKKMISLALVLMMVAVPFLAMAEATKSPVPEVVVVVDEKIESNLGQIAEATPQLKQINDAVALALLNDGNVAKYFPAELNVSANAKVAELIAFNCEGAADKLADGEVAKLVVKPVVEIKAEDKVRVLVGLSKGIDLEWVEAPVKVVEELVNGKPEVSLELELSKDLLAKMDAADAITMAILTE